jgi:hypothetical protein
MFGSLHRAEAGIPSPPRGRCDAGRCTGRRERQEQAWVPADRIKVGRKGLTGLYHSVSRAGPARHDWVLLPSRQRVRILLLAVPAHHQPHVSDAQCTTHLLQLI